MINGERVMKIEMGLCVVDCLLPFAGTVGREDSKAGYTYSATKLLPSSSLRLFPFGDATTNS
jgi:hypothetical protein